MKRCLTSPTAAWGWFDDHCCAQTRRLSLFFHPAMWSFAPYKVIQDSLGFWIFRCGFRIPDSNPLWNSWFLQLNSGSQSPEFRIPQAKITRFLESGLPYVGTRTNSLQQWPRLFIRARYRDSSLIPSILYIHFAPRLLKNYFWLIFAWKRMTESIDVLMF